MSKETFYAFCKKVKDESGIDIARFVRVAITGSDKGLPLWESIQILGVDKTMERVSSAVRLLNES